MAEYSYTVLFEPAEEGGYVVACPALPGLVTEGDTLEEARRMAADAIRGYLEGLRKEPATAAGTCQPPVPVRRVTRTPTPPVFRVALRLSF